MIRRLNRLNIISFLALAMTVVVFSHKADAQNSPKQFGNWVLSCNSGAEGQKSCEVRQLLVRSADNQLLAAMALSKTGDNYSLLAIVPLGSRLQDQPSLTIDDRASGSTGRYVQCLNQGCRVLFSANSSVVTALTRGENAQVKIVGPNGQPFTIQFSLDGFTAARKALDDRAS